jgi:5-methylcytosine-specific restriction enzyme A
LLQRAAHLGRGSPADLSCWASTSSGQKLFQRWKGFVRATSEQGAFINTGDAMPYASNQYKAFIRSSRWQRLRAAHLHAHPWCARCLAKGKHTVADEVHHKLPCKNDPVLQTDPGNLEAICRECHAPLKGAHDRGYSREIGDDGYPVDPRHPAATGGHYPPKKRKPGHALIVSATMEKMRKTR